MDDRTLKVKHNYFKTVIQPICKRPDANFKFLGISWGKKHLQLQQLEASGVPSNSIELMELRRSAFCNEDYYLYGDLDEPDEEPTTPKKSDSGLFSDIDHESVLPDGFF